MMKNLLIQLFFLSLLVGCSTFGDKDEDETITWDAERLYNEAKGSLDAGYFDEAVELYEKLERRFPFGVYGQQSLLDLAYAYYKANEPDQSISASNRFIKLYPQNAHVDYAYYLRGLANFNRGKGLVSRLLPKDEAQRDQGSAQQAFQDFNELVRKFPESDYRADAEQRMRYLRNNLAQNEVYIATYYMRRGAFVAAVNRARYVIENFQRTPSVPDALLILAKAYRVLEMEDLANDAIRVLENNYPNHPGLNDVKNVKIIN